MSAILKSVSLVSEHTSVNSRYVHGVVCVYFIQKSKYMTSIRPQVIAGRQPLLCDLSGVNGPLCDTAGQSLHGVASLE